MVQRRSDRGRRGASVGSPHTQWCATCCVREERRERLNTQGVTHRIVNTPSVLRDLGDPYTSEYPAADPQLADVEA